MSTEINLLFSIITPTHKRRGGLQRAVDSLLAQKYTHWEMIIINDSPEDASYTSFLEEDDDDRIRYYTNDKNEGVNYSRNRALDLVSNKSEWIIFLDDDDYFIPDTLSTFKALIDSHKNTSWFLTNRSKENGQSLTFFPENNNFYNYAWDYLISKRCNGDATHCIHKEVVGKKRFSTKIKQGEEWFFFYQIGLREKIFYHNHNSTISGGYDKESGLNFRKRTRRERFRSLGKLVSEGRMVNISHQITFWAYICLRIIKTIIKPE